MQYLGLIQLYGLAFIHLAQPHMSALGNIKKQYIEAVSLVKMQEEPYAL